MKRIVLTLLIITLLPCGAFAEGGKCNGRFLNPITDICWSCMFPITIGKTPLIRSSKFKDTKNPRVPRFHADPKLRKIVDMFGKCV